MGALLFAWILFIGVIVLLFQLHGHWSETDPAKADALMVGALLLVGGIVGCNACNFQEPGHDYEVYLDD
mgnify:CR=1 FL=1